MPCIRAWQRGMAEEMHVITHVRCIAVRCHQLQEASCRLHALAMFVHICERSGFGIEKIDQFKKLP